MMSLLRSRCSSWGFLKSTLFLTCVLYCLGSVSSRKARCGFCDPTAYGRDCGGGKGDCQPIDDAPGGMPGGQCSCYSGAGANCGGTEKCEVLPDYGGGTCLSGADCGNWDGGSCKKGTCQCFEGWTCSHCSIREKEFAGGTACPKKTVRAFEPGGVDPKRVPRGGARCTHSGQCYSRGGGCLGSSCFCYSGWTCPNCENTEDNLRKGTGKCGFTPGGVAAAGTMMPSSILALVITVVIVVSMM
eukprot:GFYU01000313.1.p1 GENE.GFYU01000313.1~~GFYU01000313.1.p1  ORF type:complete len:243 (-),score=11.53 GFYU01000313.1:311-1039(-)